MLKKLLGNILNLANRDILFAKYDFYEVKKNILLKYGTKISTEIQHIKNDCYSCNSTGIFRSNFKMAETCWSCGGNGVYNEFYSLLDLYKLGNYYFHLPIRKERSIESLQVNVDGFNIIKGYIKHDSPKNNIGKECTFLLFLIFDFSKFTQHLGKNKYYGKVVTPIVLINNFIWNIKHFNIKKYIPTLPKKKQQLIFDDELPF